MKINSEHPDRFSCNASIALIKRYLDRKTLGKLIGVIERPGPVPMNYVRIRKSLINPNKAVIKSYYSKPDGILFYLGDTFTEVFDESKLIKAINNRGN